ncbi:SAVED domain-containing protein [Candidatus Poriferisodalis sp.]|uniref:SAVED domain-containing protein n=1 Tax=Candidatus Poriferisodalis sp. TaxID=3101277 RepID=UPI003D0E5EAF
MIGDDLQFLIGWYWALALLKPNNIVAIEIEAADAANLDDVIIRRSAADDTYCQVKASVDGTRPLTLDWLTGLTPRGGASILKRFFDFWKDSEGMDLRLITNKSLDSHDPLLSQRNANGYLADALRRPKPSSTLNDAVQELLEHLGTDKATLVRFLDQLRIDTDASITAWRDKIVDCAMPSVASDTASLFVGAGWIREQVGRTRPVLKKSDVEAAVNALGLRTEPPAATIAIAALQEIPSDDALVHLDLRSHLHPSGGTRASARWPEIASRVSVVGDQCLAAGHTRVHVRGACRLPLWFAAGCSLRETRGFDIATFAHSREWSSSNGPELAATNTTLADQLLDGGGDEFAIAVSVVADDPTSDVAAFLAGSGHNGPLFRIRRSHPEVPIDPAQGQPLALAIRNEVRTLCRKHRPAEIHLFLICPAPVALLLGHLWDRFPRTNTYELLGSGHGYERAIEIESS